MPRAIYFDPPIDAHRYCQHVGKHFLTPAEIEEAGDDCYFPLCPCLEDHLKAKKATVGSAPPPDEGGSMNTTSSSSPPPPPSSKERA